VSSANGPNSEHFCLLPLKLLQLYFPFSGGQVYAMRRSGIEQGNPVMVKHLAVALAVCCILSMLKRRKATATAQSESA
jgi:hypothetical protein